MNQPITVTNSFSGSKEKVVPRVAGEISMYVCGITPYDLPHIGHGRVYVTFDVFYRLLTFLGYKVSYCRNFTDVDDKLIEKAEKEFNNPARYQEVAQRYIAAFHEQMGQLNCLRPTYEPLVTENIPQIIAFVQGLIDAGKAYESNGDVYFHVRSFSDYGKLSKRNLDDLKAGARVEVSDIKKDPSDFALWKSEPEGHFWQSPWGWGRPGWHIECSAMASRFLGNHIDIHAGGLDLTFPHHENEIAQSEGLHGKPFARYWMHNAFVLTNKEKMSKSLGNFVTLKDLLGHFDPMVLRFYYLSHSYNVPLEFSVEEVERLQKTYQKLCKMLKHAGLEPVTDQEAQEFPLGQMMLKFLCDDLNTPGMFGVVFEHAKEIEHNARAASVVKAILQRVLGLSMEPLAEQTVEITPEIQALLDARVAARAAKDWAAADKIRDQLKELGVDVQDKKL